MSKHAPACPEFRFMGMADCTCGARKSSGVDCGRAEMPETDMPADQKPAVEARRAAVREDYDLPMMAVHMSEWAQQIRDAEDQQTLLDIADDIDLNAKSLAEAQRSVDPASLSPAGEEGPKVALPFDGERADLLRRVDALKGSRNSVHWLSIAPLLLQDVSKYLKMAPNVREGLPVAPVTEGREPSLHEAPAPSRKFPQPSASSLVSELKRLVEKWRKAFPECLRCEDDYHAGNARGWRRAADELEAALNQESSTGRT